VRVKKLKEKNTNQIPNRNRISKDIFTILVITTLLLNTYSLTFGQTKQDPLWQKEPKVLWTKTPDNLWYLNGHRNGPNNKAWKTTADAIRNAYQSNKSETLTKNLGKIFVNPYNNTIFVLTKTVDKDIENDIQEVANSLPNVTVKIIQSPACLSDLEKWGEEIRLSLIPLQELGVDVTKAYITTNGTIALGVRDLTTNKIDILLKHLENKVPAGILVIYEWQGDVKYCSTQFESNRPVLAGVREYSYADVTMQYLNATTCFYVEWQSGTYEGILIAGHATGTYNDVDQIKGDTIGTTIACEMAPGYADVALVQLDNGISGTPKIWSSSNNKRVYGELYLDDFYEGQELEWTGVTSGIITCEIQEIEIAVRDQQNNYLYDQVAVDTTAQGGDSGAPIYEIWWEPSIQEYTCFAAGIIWGSVPGESYFSPIDGIESELGYNLDFDG